jgi:hypothetical protein
VVRTSHSRGLRPRWCGLGLTLCLSLVLAACSPADEGPAGAVPTAPVATTAPTEEPTEEPLSLTVEEANEILAELSELEGDIFRFLIATQEDAPEAHQRLEETFDGPALEAGREALPEMIEADPSVETLLGGDPIRRAREVVHTDSACVAVLIDEDFSPVIAGADPGRAVIALVPAAVDGSNKTGWKIASEYPAADSTPRNPCRDVT